MRSLLPALAVLVGSSQLATAETRLQVVANLQVKGSQISRAALTQIFLKQAPRYADGVLAQPVDQSVKSPVRTAFSSRILGQPVIEVQVYWHRKMSQGVTPPPVRASDDEVLVYVAQTPGAIGYVSGAATVPDTVKVIEVAN